MSSQDEKLKAAFKTYDKDGPVSTPEFKGIVSTLDGTGKVLGSVNNITLINSNVDKY